jgi:hypothetical protein
VFTTVVPCAASRDQHAAVNYASKPRLELEPAELNVRHLHRSNPDCWREATLLPHRPPSRGRAPLGVSASFLASCSAFDFSLELRLDAATHLVKFRFGPAPHVPTLFAYASDPTRQIRNAPRGGSSVPKPIRHPLSVFVLNNVSATGDWFLLIHHR